EGDRAQADGSMMLGRGAFVKELERALLDGRIDLAVHSAKDMPTDPADGTDVVAFPEREDPRDALVSRDGIRLDSLPRGARIGTESPRRRAFLLHLRPDLEIAPIRGNVDTRLKKLDAGEFDALVVAVAGLARLGRSDRIAERIPPEAMLPAVGQGALAVQARVDDPGVAAAAALDDPATRAAVTAERAFLRAMGGGCRTPYAALAEAAEGRVAVAGAAVEPEGREALRDAAEGPVAEAAEVGAKLARKLLDRGAGRFAAEPGA
ncbi:MAG TPA: hydroxymethylbilane synthase, partial [Gemmatimonadota bacterium]|nr:hydroxymethylbilane synthase [Gemmatimonadota bacterium]